MKGSNSSFNSLLLSLGGSLVLTSWRTRDTLASVPARILNLTGLVSVAFSSPVQVEMKPNCQFLFEAEGVDVASCDLQIKNADCHISKKGEKMVWKRHLTIWVTHLHLQMQQQSPFSRMYSQWQKYPEPLPTGGSRSDASRLLNCHRNKVSAVWLPSELCQPVKLATARSVRSGAEGKVPWDLATVQRFKT